MINPLISVIITTFNRPQLLRGAITSVLTQGGVDFEVLIVDDGSDTYESQQIADSFQDSRIRYLRNESNIGGAASLNRGLREARGDYIAILDDDDEWIRKDKLSKQLKFLVEHQDHVAVATQVVIVDYNSGTFIMKSSYPTDDATIRRNFLFSNPIAHSSIIYQKRTVQDVGGYDTSLSRGKDYDLILKLGTRGRIAILPDHAVRYRESTSENRDIIALRLKDTRAKIALVKRHRRSYPYALRAIFVEFIRLVLFSAVRFFSI